MPLNQLETQTINKGAKLAHDLLNQVKPALDQLNVIYDAQGGVKETVVQQDLDDTESLSGLTKAQLDDAFFVLTSTLRTALANGLTQLAHLAARNP